MKRRSESPHFRTLTVADVPRVHQMEKLCFSMPWSENMLAQEIRDNPYALYLGAVEDGVLIGYVGAWRILDEAHMTNLAVHPDHRRKGIGRRLMERLRETLVKEGVRSMTLEVREGNQVARGLYASLGFRPAGRRKGYYSDNGEDAVVMWWRQGDCQRTGE